MGSSENKSELRGWLTEQHSVTLLTINKRRWYFQEGHQLRVQKKPGKEDCDLIDLREISLETPNRGPNDPYVFTLITPKKAIRLCADNEHDYRYWIEGLFHLMSTYKGSKEASITAGNKTITVDTIQDFLRANNPPGDMKDACVSTVPCEMKDASTTTSCEMKDAFVMARPDVQDNFNDPFTNLETKESGTDTEDLLVAEPHVETKDVNTTTDEIEDLAQSQEKQNQLTCQLHESLEKIEQLESELKEIKAIHEDRTKEMTAINETLQTQLDQANTELEELTISAMIVVALAIVFKIGNSVTKSPSTIN